MKPELEGERDPELEAAVDYSLAKELPADLAAELNKIGWDCVKTIDPLLALSLASKVSQTGGYLFESKADANIARNKIIKLRKAMDATRQGLLDLPQRSSTAIETVSAYLSNDTDLDWHRVADVLDAISAIEASVTALELAATKQAKLGVRGTPRHDVAHDVADALAHIYVIGTGRRPTCGSDAVTGKINCEFGTAVERIFQVLGFVGVGAETYAEAARDRLSPTDFRQLKAIGSQSRRMHRSISTGTDKGSNSRKHDDL